MSQRPPLNGMRPRRKRVSIDRCVIVTRARSRGISRYRISTQRLRKHGGTRTRGWLFSYPRSSDPPPLPTHTCQMIYLDRVQSQIGPCPLREKLVKTQIAHRCAPPRATPRCSLNSRDKNRETGGSVVNQPENPTETHEDARIRGGGVGEGTGERRKRQKESVSQ